MGIKLYYEDRKGKTDGRMTRFPRLHSTDEQHKSVSFQTQIKKKKERKEN